MIESLITSNTSALELAPGICIGCAVDPGLLPIVNQPLLILVGLTGVGKSTVTTALYNAGFNFTILPNRRTLTDKFIIPTVALSETTFDPLCRLKRLNYTRKYKQLFPGGMAHVLNQLQIDSSQVNLPLFFDGLRGENEVNYAINTFTKAKFLLLEASDWVRLQRLLFRNDSFDQVTKVYENDNDSIGAGIYSFTELGVPEAGNLFSSEVETEILSQVRQGKILASVLRDKLKIVVEERQNYDPVNTRAILEKFAPHRTLIIDTTNHTPQQIAQNLIQFL